ncbi:DUF339-domain-containing protein [Annulohypoxylon bovei var. microspora]|nr:DUF339-domain-containing protein [Annulohypoxylon bovei var. microspora]
MASAASAIPRSIMRAARRPSSVTAARQFLLHRPLSSTSARRAGVFPGNPPPMEPHKQRGPQAQGGGDIAVGELEGTDFRIEPMKRVGEDDGTMRARLVYQSRKRGILETDLLLSTFADAYLPTMTREQMAQYDRFLDENDWDIYYWATQEPPPNAVSYDASSSSPSTSSGSPAPSIETADTSSASYAGGVEAAISEATPLDTSPSSQGSSIPTASTASPSLPHQHHLSEPLATGGIPTTGDMGEGKEPATAAAAAAASAEPYSQQGEVGEWAQTVGTFKPAYRPVPARWRESEVLRLLRDHVKARAKERGGMAFMPALRHP